MEHMNKKLKVSSQEVQEYCTRILTIDDLPREMFIKILGYLKVEELCRVGRVSKKWYTTTRSLQRVDIHFSLECGSMSEAAMKFVQGLTPHVTHLRLSFDHAKDWILDLKELAITLENRCPNLQVLVFHGAIFTTDVYGIHLYEQLLASIRILALIHCVPYIMDDLASHLLHLEDSTDTSKLEVLDISRSKLTFNDASMPCVKKMYLAGSLVGDTEFHFNPTMVKNLEVLDLEGTCTGCSAFKAVCQYSSNLVELYMCRTKLQDKDLIFDDGSLPRLQKLCIRDSKVTYNGVNLLLKACKSLMHVYVGDLRDDGKYDNFKSNSKKVHVIHGFSDCNHSDKLNHMLV